eukprot:6218401-Amphidinium_carterae.1
MAACEHWTILHARRIWFCNLLKPIISCRGWSFATLILEATWKNICLVSSLAATCGCGAHHSLEAASIVKGLARGSCHE